MATRVWKRQNVVVEVSCGKILAVFWKVYRSWGPLQGREGPGALACRGTPNLTPAAYLPTNERQAQGLASRE